MTQADASTPIGSPDTADAADTLNSAETQDAARALLPLFSDAPVAVLTGAGISTDSGIPDYRGKGSPPRTPMRIDQYMNDLNYRRRFWAGARVGSERMGRVHPNAGHLALAHLEAAGRIDGVITQNVDGLHRRAGSRTVVELHGSGAAFRCTNCGHRASRAEVLGAFDALNPGFAEDHAGAEIAPDGDAIVPTVVEVIVPPCPVCGGILRPDVVYFGETVPTEVFAAAESLLNGAGALLLAGTSLAVNTGVRLVQRAERRGIPIAIINRGATSVDARAAVRIEGGTTEVLRALAAQL